MKYIILGMVGIPVGGFLISAIYHYWITGTCIMKPDLSGIKLMYKKIKRMWLNNSQTKYLTELARDPVLCWRRTQKKCRDKSLMNALLLIVIIYERL